MSTIDILGGKVPQRAIRYLDQLPYVATYALQDTTGTIVGVDFGGADESFVIATPANRRAKVIEASVYNVSENFAGTTTKSSIEVGDGSDQDGFCYTNDFTDGGTAQVFTTYDGTITAGALGDVIEPGDQVTVTCVASTGTPTGIAQASVTFLYFE